MKNIVVNWFVDYDKEEKWLNEMSQNGWCLWHTNGFIYRFKRCEKGEYIFQIDYCRCQSYSICLLQASSQKNLHLEDYT